MELVMSTNGGLCHNTEINMMCPECGNTHFTMMEGESWIGHNKREMFMIAVCDNENCKKKIDISIDVS